MAFLPSLMGCSVSLWSEDPVIKDQVDRDPSLHIEGFVFMMDDKVLYRIDPNSFDVDTVLVHSFSEATPFRVNKARSKALFYTSDRLTEYSLNSGKVLRQIDGNIYRQPGSDNSQNLFFGYLGNDTTIWYLNQFSSYNYRVVQIGPRESIPPVRISGPKRNSADITAMDVSPNNDIAFTWSYLGQFYTYDGKVLHSDTSNKANRHSNYGFEEPSYLEWSDDSRYTSLWKMDKDFWNKSFANYEHTAEGVDYSEEFSPPAVTYKSVMGPTGRAFLVPHETEDGVSMLYVYQLFELDGNDEGSYKLVKAIKTGFNPKLHYLDWE